ncbi:hypothetical protein DYU05_04055 [Mucilaginibacter terrenus]|uniref:Uncharacterized protein n=1 Tax=Mucilaginibacter terrenus TaxID=2482727 RepID=A0A3E2NUY8_9SPHI|nr:hypothetical protein [Mucilaginibacter terrenus]RFZ84789.1 hypothetical protein DYU05_04055 [Mucilaginibacter terrenus]
MKYGIDMHWHVSITVDAETPEHALELAAKIYPNHTADYMYPEKGTCISVYSCNGCGAHILEGKIAGIDPETGDSYCSDCAEAMKEADRQERGEQ